MRKAIVERFSESIVYDLVPFEARNAILRDKAKHGTRRTDEM